MPSGSADANVSVSRSISELAEPTTGITYPELYHYTGWNGLCGIWTTGTLWATDYKSLNDNTELVLLMDYLKSQLETRLLSYLNSRVKIDSAFKIELLRKGTIATAAKQIPADLIKTFYDVSFGESEDVAFIEPFITSFCSHLSDEKYVQRNGLLSQWRAYGSEERYSIVFDTPKLEKLLIKESEIYQYNFGNFFDVIYSNKVAENPKRLLALVDHVEELMVAMINNEKPSLEVFFSLFVLAAASLKHEGFHEEREIRIVNSPYTKKLDDYLRLHSDSEIEKPQKKFKTIHVNPTTGKKYISLFDFNETRKLPIKRIIVGPHRRKEENAQKVKNLVKGRVSVHVSATPFIG